MVDAIPLSYSANNWFSIHRKPGVDWEGRVTKEDRKHKVIEEFYDPIDSARAITRSLLSRGFRIGANGFLPIKNLYAFVVNNPSIRALYVESSSILFLFLFII